MRSKRLAHPILISLLLTVLACEIAAAEMTVHHDLTIVLSPAQSELEGRDRIRIGGCERCTINLRLSSRARIRGVRVDGHNYPYTFAGERLSLNMGPAEAATDVEVSVDYICRFDDPAPLRPVNTDNPGLGVSGTISARGTFLLSGAGWYPRVTESRESFDLRVDSPGDYVAVTAGRLLDISHGADRTVSRWRIDDPLDGLSLSAGPYDVQRKTEDGFTAATYLFPENRGLSARYLDASLHYMKLFSDLFGAYPFAEFAVVENFFPTGYGFPGYTLMGGVVLRLPFIPRTSLPHEIAHSWWGNGVLVALASGNWCEGLTTYTADYLIKERQSAGVAMDYRRQAMRNYASLVSDTTDFPLDRFRSRIDPATKAIGYDKSAMVFHMLRREVGDAAFWAALRDLYDRFLFRHASWQDIQMVFADHAARPLDRFFNQWVNHSGAPQLRLENVRRLRNDGQGYRVIGRLAQHDPFFDIAVPLAVETAEGTIEQTVHLSGRTAKFEIATRDQPLAVTADPDYHLFRRLTANEMPPTINTLKGSSSLVLVLAKELGATGPALAGRFSRAMGVEPVRVVSESDLSAADTVKNDLVFIGLPRHMPWTRWTPGEVEVGTHTFRLSGQTFDQPTDVLFCVLRHPENPGKVVALLHPISPEAADPVLFKIPHYGRFSYLAFRQGHNRAKGTWAVETSPVMVRFDTDGVTRKGTGP
jgi:hypothetical protein